MLEYVALEGHTFTVQAVAQVEGGDVDVLMDFWDAICWRVTNIMDSWWKQGSLLSPLRVVARVP
jgi:hypothetical protein